MPPESIAVASLKVVELRAELSAAELERDAYRRQLQEALGSDTIASIASSFGAIASTRGQALLVFRRSSNACTSVTSSMSDHLPSSVLTPTPQACNLSL